MIRNIDSYEQNIEKNRSEKRNRKLEREKTIIGKKNQNKLSPISKAAAKL